MNICILGTFRPAVAYKVMTKCTAHLKCRIDRHLVATPINNHVRPRGHAGRNSLPLSLPLPSPLFPPLSPPLLTCLVSVLPQFFFTIMSLIMDIIVWPPRAVLSLLSSLFRLVLYICLFPFRIIANIGR